MKVHIVTIGNRGAYVSQLQAMHRRRHEVFVSKLKWRLRSEGGLEIDEYDDEHAVYLLSIEDGQLHGSLRLLPAWRRSLAADHLGQFLSLPSEPRAADTWEWTRWLPGMPDHRREFVRSRQALFLASLEFAASRGAARYTAICSPRSVGELEELNWRPRPLGLPTPYEEGVAMAVEWSVTPDLLARTRALFRWSGPAAFEVVAHDPQGPGPQLLDQAASLRTPDAVAALQSFLDGWRPRARAPERLQLVASHGRA